MATEWQHLPEVPAAEELVFSVSSTAPSRGVSLDTPNIQLVGSSDSNEVYLGTQYRLLREDSLRRLREAVQHVKKDAASMETAEIGIYDKAHICGITSCTRGIAARLSFSTGRSGKKIAWEQSKRLLTGSLAVLTPRTDMFANKALPCIIAARPLSGLDKNLPEIDIFFRTADDIEIDPAIEWVLVEDRGGFFEADRHTLVALQTLLSEGFPLSKYIVKVRPIIDAPLYIRDQSTIKVDTVIEAVHHPEKAGRWNVTHDWPERIKSDLDLSQLAALSTILAKEVAIVQGPPGTGKTHVSVAALKIMLDNLGPGDPPIVVACQTNHALDQLLRHVANFESQLIRLGGQSTDNGIISERTLFKVRQTENLPEIPGTSTRASRRKMAALGEEITALLEPFGPDKGTLDSALLLHYRLLTETQVESLAKGLADWKHDVGSFLHASEIGFWLKNHVSTAKSFHKEVRVFDMEEVELEYEQLKATEAESGPQDDPLEALNGTFTAITETYICKPGRSLTEDNIKTLLRRYGDLFNMPDKYRSTVYIHLRTQVKQKIRQAIREKASEYARLIEVRQTARRENDVVLLKQQKVIGVTTTGLSKYRKLISAVGPRTVLIEEAAETREAPVVAACVPTLQHLILVGDHKQLRPRCRVRELEGEPHHLDVSLFERLVHNHLEFTTLNLQRRMIPEVRRLLDPIYHGVIQDHRSVMDRENRPSIPGMGGIGSYWFDHDWPESKDVLMSTYNKKEAEMVVGFYKYLFLNGIDPKSITVLTFYQGQRKLILRKLFSDSVLKGQAINFKVVTVDSYQGEENDIILLSLVRNNQAGQPGFLTVENRACVALSRAKRGLFIFGHATKLQQKSQLWRQIWLLLYSEATQPEANVVLAHPPRRVGVLLPVICQKHSVQYDIADPAQFECMHGGCGSPCEAFLSCGHKCELLCHPFAHDRVVCNMSCSKMLHCGHPCVKECSEMCECKTCRGRKTVDEDDEPGHKAQMASTAVDKTVEVSKAATANVLIDHPSAAGFEDGRKESQGLDDAQVATLREAAKGLNLMD